MSSSTAPFFVLLGVAVVGLLSYAFSDKEDKKAESDELERLQEEAKLAKQQADKSYEEWMVYQQNLVLMDYEANKDYYEKKAIRAEKRLAQQYHSPTYHDVAKYQHNGSQYVIFDLETTGFNVGRSQITEIAAVRYVHDKPVASFQTLVQLKKGTRVGPKVVEITGITTGLLKEQGMPLDEAIKKFIDFIGDDCLMAYNIEFDLSFIEYAYGKVLPNKNKCLYRLARQRWRSRDSYKLVNIARDEDLMSTEGAHRAMKDVELAHALLIHIAY